VSERVDTIRAMAERIDASATEIYPEDIWPTPTSADYDEINALLKRERGHQLDPVAADCMRRAFHVIARMLRDTADDIEAEEDDA